MATLWKFCSQIQIARNILQPRFDLTEIAQREVKRLNHPPRKRIPPWLPKPFRVIAKDHVTQENKEFIQEYMHEKYPASVTNHLSPLKDEPIEPQAEWTPKSRRTGVLAKKIGVYPLWMKNGKQVMTTLLQVIDNHVIKYIPPEHYNPVIGKPRIQVKKKLGCIVVGADSADPQYFTKDYCSQFDRVGLMPKRALGRFTVTPDAALQPGTPLFASHYKPGDYVDVRGKTVDRGFQGVMKRWGFHGMPATHGVTKTHRRPGNIGSGGQKARVMPGTKLPGHMGNRYRVLRGVRILRINTKYNILWVLGKGIPGETNNVVQLFDTVLPLKKLKEPPVFPTYFPTGEGLPEELFVDDLHEFGNPTIEFEDTQANK